MANDYTMGRKRIEAVMAKHGLNQQQLAKKLGVHPITISNIIRGKSRPGDKVAGRLNRVFGIPLDEVLTREQLEGRLYS